MQLQTDSTEIIDDPSAEQIANALQALKDDDKSFAVLSASGQVFIQCSRTSSGGFYVEYREGGDERHFRATDEDIPLAAVTCMFQDYAAGQANWKRGYSWALLEQTCEPQKSESLPQARERPIEFAYGHLIIGKSCFLQGLAIIVLLIGVTGLLAGGIADVRFWASCIAISAILFIAAAGSDSDTRYRF